MPHRSNSEVINKLTNLQKNDSTSFKIIPFRKAEYANQQKQDPRTLIVATSAAGKHSNMGHALGVTSFGSGQQTRQRVKSMQANYAGLPLSSSLSTNNAATVN